MTTKPEIPDVILSNRYHFFASPHTSSDTIHPFPKLEDVPTESTESEYFHKGYLLDTHPDSTNPYTFPTSLTELDVE